MAKKLSVPHEMIPTIDYYVVSTTQYEPVVILNVGDSVKLEYFGQIADRMYLVSSVSLK